ncbi:MAG: S41 family peptidase [Bacteroidota bacterium]
MKNTILFLVISLLCLTSVTAQEKLTATEKLASLGKIYGFLKYYHPNVAKGEFDINTQIMAYIPKVIDANDAAALSTIYIDWLNELGEIEVCKNCNDEIQYFEKNFDLSWIENSTVFTSALSSKLRYIEQNRNQDANQYVAIREVGNVQVTETTYPQLSEYPAEAYRLLGLFMYWNIIEYFFPYKYLTDQHWDEVLLEMIPKFRKATNKTEYRTAIKELVAKLDDSHAWLSFEQEKVKHLPVKITHVENKAVVSGFYNDSIAKANNLQLGDIITKIDNSGVATELAKAMKFRAASNENGKTKLSYLNICTGLSDSVNLTLIRDGNTQQIKAKRYNFKDFKYRNNPKAIKSKSISDAIGYINVGTIGGKEVSKIFKSFKNKKVIIIDARNYPSVSSASLTRFTHSEKRDFYSSFSPDITYPGKFTYKTPRKTSGGRKVFKGNIIVLVNGDTFSRGEFFVMALQTGDRVTTVGTQTGGADGDVVTFNYLGGYRTAMSGNGIAYPDGTATQRKGIHIDVLVTPTINGLQQGRDEVLEKAIEIANQKK